MVPIADGSDLGGSLRNPASFCGVVGFRPSVGLVPSWPDADPEDLSVDGPMARNVEDAALLLSVMADRPDLAVVAAQAADLDGLCVAWAPACAATMPIDPEVVSLVDAARPRFEALRCRVEEAYPDLTGAREVFFTLRAQGFATEYGPLLAQHRSRIKDTVLWNIELGLALTGDDIARAHALAADIRRRADAFFETFDVLIQPVTQVAPFPVEIEYPTEVAGVAMATYIDWMESCWSITVLGGPAISVPCGRNATGLPVGIQIVGPRGDDAAVLRMARAFEQTGPPAAVPFA
jgi:amidase